MALTAYRPYTQRARSPLQTLATARPAPRAYGVARMPERPVGQPDPWQPPTRPPNYGDTGGTGTVTDNRNQPADYHNPPPPGYETDPVYQQITALANQSVADAQAQATASRKSLAINLGDPGLANSLGLGSDTAYAAQNNPYSILSNLLRGHVGDVQGINAGTNAQNLFFSSARGKQLGQEQTGYQGQRYGAAQAAQGQLAQIAAMLLQVQRQAAMDKANAAGDWAARHANDPATQQQTQLYALANLLAGKGYYSAADVKQLSPTTVLRLIG